METHSRFESTLTVLTCELEDPGYYGRILRDGDGKVTAIREFSDATPEELKTREVNTGIYIMSTEYLRKVLPGIGMTNVQGELYLTDTIEAAIQEGRVVSPLRLADHREMQGINTRADLARVHRYYYERVHERLMDSGVTILDPEHTYIDHQTTVGRDTIIHPGVVLARSHLGSACVIHAHSVITDCAIGDETAVLPSSVLTESTMGQACSIGPFAHMRPGCILGDRVRFGNFVEGKKANLADGVKAGHLTYLGDCTVGQNVNIGCGTITCNYDGTRKHQTIIEEGVFIGSDTQLVAPVTVGKDAYVGAGSTITQDVPPGALAVARSKQRNIPGWVLKRKEKS